MTSSKDLSNWLKTEISENGNKIFDLSADLFDIIITELNDNELHLKAENKILMIKLCKFLYENSYT